MESDQRMEIFISVHKAIRKGLMDLSIHLSRLDWTDESDVQSANLEFTQIVRFMREHADNEDLIQFPMLKDMEPQAVQKSVEDHHRLDFELDILEKQWLEVTASPNMTNAGYEFYRAYNRYLSDYLHHMDREEGEVTQAIYRHFTDAKIDAEFTNMINRIAPQDLGMMLSYMLPSLSNLERLEFLKKLKKNAPPETFEEVKALAKKILSLKDFEKLTSLLG